MAKNKQEQKVLKTSAPRVNFMFAKQKSKNIIKKSEKVRHSHKYFEISHIKNIGYQKYWVSEISGIRNIRYQKYQISGSQSQISSRVFLFIYKAD